MVYDFNYSNKVYSQNSRVIYVWAAWITLEWLSVFWHEPTMSERKISVCMK